MYIKLADKLICVSDIREAHPDEGWGQFFIRILYKGVSGDSTIAYATRNSRDKDYELLCSTCMAIKGV